MFRVRSFVGKTSSFFLPQEGHLIMVITFSYEVDGSQHSAVAGSNATLTTPESGSSSAGDLFGHFLKYFFPILTAVNIPLSLTNFLVFLKLGFLNSPSNFIYFNLVIVDLLNSAVGLKVSINLWNATDNATHYVAFWGDKKYEFERYVNNFTFDTNIVLVFGLCLIRILWMEMSALHVLEKLKTVSIAMIVLAYSYGLISCVYRFLLQKNYKYSDGTDRIFQTPLVEVKDICESLLVVLIILMSVYIQLKVWMKKSQLESSIFRAASYASCIITANVLFSYTFYIITVGVRVRHVVTSNNTYSCPGNDEGSAGGRRDGTFKFVDFILCDELYISTLFMCFHCTINSIVLIFQRHTRRFLRNKARICIIKLREAYLRLSNNEETDYAYF